MAQYMPGLDTGVDTVPLEDTGFRLRQGFDAWNREGAFAFRALNIKTVFIRRAAYFRVNATGKVYRVESKQKTVEIRAVRRSSGE